MLMTIIKGLGIIVVILYLIVTYALIKMAGMISREEERMHITWDKEGRN